MALLVKVVPLITEIKLRLELATRCTSALPGFLGLGHWRGTWLAAALLPSTCKGSF